MQVLTHIIERVKDDKKNGKQPVVVLDLDDTLIDCRYRKMAIMAELASDLELLRRFPELAHLKKLQLERVQYRLEHTLNTVGLNQLEIVEAARAFWKQRNFTNHYLRHDKAFSGAVEYVQMLAQEGATLVYLSARAEEDMGEGTRLSLEHLCFPLSGAHRIWLKPRRSQNDFAFKEEAMRELARNSHVVALFENEIPHLNLAAHVFQQTTLVWLDTLYAPNPPPPHERVQRVTGFILGIL